MLALYLRIRNLFVNEEGQDLIEYALLAGLLALAVVTALTLAGGTLETLWDNIETALDNAANAGS